jgi:hypothetical protein
MADPAGMSLTELHLERPGPFLYNGRKYGFEQRDIGKILTIGSLELTSTLADRQKGYFFPFTYAAGVKYQFTLPWGELTETDAGILIAKKGTQLLIPVRLPDIFYLRNESGSTFIDTLNALFPSSNAYAEFYLRISSPHAIETAGYYNEVQHRMVRIPLNHHAAPTLIRDFLRTSQKTLPAICEKIDADLKEKKERCKHCKETLVREMRTVFNREFVHDKLERPLAERSFYFHERSQGIE